MTLEKTRTPLLARLLGLMDGAIMQSFKDCDADGDDKISFDEFASALQKLGFTPESDVFHELDKEQAGAISAAQFKKYDSKFS